MRTLNLGILAHVDAGKTSLTERLLYAAGVIDEIGSVDGGNTQTDSLDQERRRGITIKAAVAAFVVGEVAVNLIDTPGHPDFIAEVERVLSVLDGAVLVVSAVEGVQAQTRVLMRTLQRLRIPTLIFINKIDRRGADPERVLRSITERLTPAVAPMGVARAAGERDAAFVPFGAGDAERLSERLAEQDEALMADYVGGAPISPGRLRKALRRQTRQGRCHPVFLGSAITGAGTEALMAGITTLLPAAEGDGEAPVCGTVFKVERGPAGEKIAYARLFSGTIHVRDWLTFGQDRTAKITALSVFDRGPAVATDSAAAGQIVKLWGLADIQIGDNLGVPRTGGPTHHFAPPTLETVIYPRHPGEGRALHAALVQLAEQDPLINLRQDDLRQELFVSLYGEVQKEVIGETLAKDYGVEAEFRETRVICIERPTGVGTAMEQAPYPFIATIGLRVEPGVVDSGVEFQLEVEFGSLPLAFHKAVEESVRETLGQGLHGWRVTDCKVTMTHGIRYRDWATSTPSEHRNLTPLVLMAALQRAGVQVCEPVHRFGLEIPADVLGPMLPVLAKLGAAPGVPEMRGPACWLEGDIPAARVHDLQQQLPGLTRGEGVLEAAFDHYRPVRGETPSRPRTDNNPLNRKDYLTRVARRG
ncbi:TetM/TetW/TetO/TetS family tetracycline resistance ribosomal protection protein [Phenylobacterium sp.]|uniref:TetM/TetW/TetO/TetS family tetracycline resistance ribosomal protection protein n=1 Tax=Phenylobacterium sp. TaxID=1871053 RepID=UPI00286DEC7B|nr:TetM/TetW/TetO/TetS family tetracycline resistance ribosomal protection protein [Phenylobacterium sp.]